MVCFWKVFLITALSVAFVPSKADEEYSDGRLSREKRFINIKRTLIGYQSLPKLKVAVIVNPPYTMKTTYPDGRISYTGFIPDVIGRIGRIVGFRPEFVETGDKSYGRLENGSWTGMIGGLIKTERNQSGGIDIAAADMTITRAREEVVDFVTPFQHIGLTILIKKPHFSVTTMQDTSDTFWPFNFTIFSPLTGGVWALVTLFVLVVGVVLWVMNKFNPYEWSGRYNLGLASEQQAEAFNLSGSLWFVFTSLQWQGFERAPRSLGAKLLTIFWFAFVTIVLITYTASLVNHLFWASMVHGEDPTNHPIDSLRDLIQNPDYDYGCIQGSSTYTLLSQDNSLYEYSVMKKYWATEKGNKQLVDNETQALERLRNNPHYGFIMESAKAKYHANKLPCDLMTVGETFALRSFGFALPNNSSDLDEFHKAVLQLKEEGVMEMLEQRWWENKGQCWNVTQIENMISTGSKLMVNKPKRVNVEMFVGPIALIVCGIVLSVIVMIAEVLYFKYRGRYQENNRPQGQVLKLDADEGNI